jgi:site-specific DNA-methyltransferase (adenine-specific)
MNIDLKHGDCLDKLKELPDNSVDSIVTDPPYGISFMNAKWDYDVPSTDVWIECLRVLKPGGHLLSFSGSRTYHRMVVRIEDAGFDIRDQIMWVYGSGFPKSHNIGKAVDKIEGNEREVVDTKEQTGAKFKEWSNDPNETRWHNQGFNKVDGKQFDITKGNSEWEGWGTALKPSHEPIVMARKPLSEKSVAENVLRWGTGGLNIDVSRIGLTSQKDLDDYRFNMDGNLRTTKKDGEKLGMYDGGWKVEKVQKELPEGRWPANIIFDEEAGQVLDQQSGISKTNQKQKDRSGLTSKNAITPFKRGATIERQDKGGASRFFYCPKASKKDRDEGLDEFENKTGSEITGRKEGSAGLVMEDDKQNPYAGKASPINKNNHPTVKPTELMLYLIKLVTPVNGTVMDCFLGSGSTGKAAVRGGFDFIGIEKEEEYIKIAEARIKNEIKD